MNKLAHRGPPTVHRQRRRAVVAVEALEMRLALSLAVPLLPPIAASVVRFPNGPITPTGPPASSWVSYPNGPIKGPGASEYPSGPVK
jgi:hypothetical protein